MIPRIVLPFLALPLFALHAETLLEFNFQNFDEGARTIRAGAHRASASPYLLTSPDGVSVEVSHASGISSASPALAKGSVLIGDRKEGNGFLQTTAEKPETASYAAFVGTAGFGKCAIAIVFQPTFSGAKSAKGGKQRNCLFATSFRGTAAETLLFQIGNNLMLSFGSGNAASPGQKVTLSQPDWDPAKWYFLAASWAPGQKPVVFWREIGTAQDHFAAGPEPLVDCPRRINKPVRLGNSGHNDASLGGDNPLNGRLAYFLWLDEYIPDAEGFARLYQRVVSGRKSD